MILERTQSVFGRSLVQVFKIADSKSFLKSKAIKTKKIRSTVVEGNYFRSKKKQFFILSCQFPELGHNFTV